ncbi:MAG TPA: flavodoxin family protein [Firmicutes bacterium]|jgi:multimeric flavodoxin WrbA|nr:flavodoxin family protein [Bacillota bacterium]
MLVLGISGSPRRNGNTEILLDEALKSAGEAGADTEKVILQKMKFSPCIACGSCDNTGICVLKDDMQELYEKIIAADALIVSTPIYFYNVSACLKAAIDRAQALWARRY